MNLISFSTKLRWQKFGKRLFFRRPTLQKLISLLFSRAYAFHLEMLWKGAEQ